MKLPILAVTLTFAASGVAQSTKSKPAAPIKPAIIAQPSTEADAPKKAQPLITSDAIREKLPLISTDLGGRDMVFIRSALDLEKTTAFLAKEAARIGSKDLHGFCAEFVRTLEAHSSVLSTMAEMKNIAIAPVSVRQQQIAERLAKLDDAALEKALVQAFIETDAAVIATYELATKSANSTIQILGEQALPQAREHLLLVQAMAGGSGALPPIGEAPKPQDAPKPAVRPAFRTSAPTPAIGQ
jgi:Domain of unknown function (DUF4142)